MAKERILVVEDNRDIAKVLELFLNEQGYLVKVTPRGRDALSLSRLELPNLILLDILLPDLDGYEVCRALRTSPRTGHIPIIFLTQKDERSDRITGLQLGVDDYITKPFDIEELGLRIQNVLQRTERERLTDPRTGLPAGKLVDEQVAGLLAAEAWGLLACRIEGFDRFLDPRPARRRRSPARPSVSGTGGRCTGRSRRFHRSRLGRQLHHPDQRFRRPGRGRAAAGSV
jgi:DNA-binding response OmpR family regulator